MRDRILAGLALVPLCALSIVRRRAPSAPVAGHRPRHRVLRRARDAPRRADRRAAARAWGWPTTIACATTSCRSSPRSGLRPQVQATTGVGTRYQVAGRVQNILAWLPGSDPHGKAVLLMAHYDGVEAGPAAADDGAGSAALLETVRALRARDARRSRTTSSLLFTDGEETGLLGAAAFVREHPWAKDVAVVVNFEARGTTGRAFMFETGPGNLDAVARASSRRATRRRARCSPTVYRMLPNDTDLSELARPRICRRSTSRSPKASSGITRATTTSRISTRAACSTTAIRCSGSRARSAAGRCRVRAPATPCSSIFRSSGS